MQCRLGVLAVLTALFVGLSRGVATAEPITYTESGVGSGTVSTGPGTPATFTNAPFTITFTGDTSNVIFASGVLANPVGTATLSVGGVGSAVFTEQLAGFDSQAGTIAGIASAVQMTEVLGTIDPAFGSYGLTTSIGPITNTPFFNSGLSFTTNLGTFTLDSVSTSTFTAIAVPEPSSVALLGLAVCGLTYCVRRRRRV